MRTWQAWVDLWTEEETASSLALFRIAIGVVVTMDALSSLIAGVIDPLYIPIGEGGLAPGNRFPSLILAALGHSSTTTWLVAYSMLGLGALSTIGLGGRLTQFALLQVVLAWHAIPADIGGGYDRLLTNALFLLCLGPCTATLSADCRLKQGAWTSGERVRALPRRLAIAQVIVMYTATGLAKHGSAWSPPFDAVYRSFQIQAWARLDDLTWLGYAWWPLAVGTAVTLWWERLFGLILVFYAGRRGWLGSWGVRLARRDWRLAFLGVGVVVHGLLGLLTNLGTFTPVTLCFYIAFARPEELEQAWRRWRDRPARPEPAPA